MQPLARSQISPAFKWPTVLPQAIPAGEVRVAANGSKGLESFRWKKRVRKRHLSVFTHTEGILHHVHISTDAAALNRNDFSRKWNLINL